MKISHSIYIATLFAICCGSANGQTTVPNAMTTLSNFWKTAVSDENNKNYDAALQQLKSFQQAGGNPFFADLRIAWIDYLKKDYKNAAVSYAAASHLHPTALNPLLGLLAVAQAENDSMQIHSAAEGIFHIDPLNYNAQMAEAALQLKAKNYHGAFAYYQRVLQFYPDDLDALSGEGWSLYYLGYIKQAAADFQTLLTINPDYAYAQQGFNLTNHEVR